MHVGFIEQRSVCAAGEVRSPCSQMETTTTFFFSPNQIIYLSRWNGNSAVSSESFKTKLMEHTHKLRHSEASKSFFPSLRGVAFSLQRVRRTHACLKCHVSVAEPARLCSTGKYTVFFPLDLVMCVSSYHHPLFYFNRDQATLAT